MEGLEQTASQPPQWLLVSIVNRATLLFILNLSHTVPSAAPTFVSVSVVTSSNFTVQWGAVDCIHRNGNITGYLVYYGIQGSAEEDRPAEMATGDSSGGMHIISGLSPATVYTVQVAAVNSAGTGVHSDPRDQLTLGNKWPYEYVTMYNLCIFPSQLQLHQSQ